MCSDLKAFCLLTIPSFTLRNAERLLVLGDNMKLTAIFKRTVAPCEAQEKQDAVADLWDMTL
jgi:hypothetical protein